MNPRNESDDSLRRHAAVHNEFHCVTNLCNIMTHEYCAIHILEGAFFCLQSSAFCLLNSTYICSGAPLFVGSESTQVAATCQERAGRLQFRDTLPV